MFLLRIIGYVVATAIVDIAVDYLEVRKMRRDFTEYENSEGGRISAHKVTEDTAGPVMVVGGTSRDVAPGDVLLATDRPDVYHVASEDSLGEYSEVSDTETDDYSALTAEDAETPADTEGDQGGDEFDPSEVSAVEVRAYLQHQSDAGNTDEVNRVVDAERAGRNRSTVINWQR